MASISKDHTPVLGTRGSPLALAQARMVAAALEKAHGWPSGTIELAIIKTTGDRVQDRPLAEIGGKALWTKELDRALLAGEIDAAVHSMKDVESVRPDSIRLAAMLERADVRDRLIGASSIDALPQNARVGTSSPRRAAQLRHLRPDLQILPFRGNVETRLAKLDAGEADATLLAGAGLYRLGRDEVGNSIPIETMLPASAQGAVGIECRSNDARMTALLEAIDHQATHRGVMAERGLLVALGGSCHSPVGALAVDEGETIWLRAEIFDEDGDGRVAGDIRFDVMDSGGPARLAADLLRQAPESVRQLFAIA